MTVGTAAIRRPGGCRPGGCRPGGCRPGGCRPDDDPDGDEWLSLVPSGGGPRLCFQRSDAAVTPWPGGGRVHLDIDVADLVAAHEHALACGAVPLTGTPEEEGHPEDPFRVYADPVGHPFCLCATSE